MISGSNRTSDAQKVLSSGRCGSHHPWRMLLRCVTVPIANATTYVIRTTRTTTGYDLIHFCVASTSASASAQVSCFEPSVPLKYPTTASFGRQGELPTSNQTAVIVSEEGTDHRWTGGALRIGWAQTGLVTQD
jgi:hypothetical protein